MKRAIVACVLAAACAGGAESAERQRVALVVGANDGGARRPTLKYGIADAERFARVLTELGGVAAGNVVLLKQPSAKALDAGFAALRNRLDDARRVAGGDGLRSDVVLYYSGHADESGLLIGDERYSYRALREALEAVPAEVRIAVVDACASGALTRVKGGEARAPFLVDTSSSMRGHAFLTSSSADESAQESDRIGGSYFTHYLVSGLRGAADASSDGAVTLGEAYQYAFRETLGRTVETRGGPQHPSYDISLAGSGEVVMTDLRKTSAGLVLTEALNGRCYVRDGSGALVVELLKARDRRLALGLAPGKYEVHCQDDGGARVARPVLTDAAPVVLDARAFSATRRDPTVPRGGLMGLPAVDQLDVRLGARPGAGYLRWVQPRLALGLAVSSIGGDSYDIFRFDGRVDSESGHVVSLLASGRADLRRPYEQARWMPYLYVGVGPHVRSSSVTTTTTETGSHTEPGLTATFQSSSLSRTRERGVAVGGQVGLGLDLRIGRRLRAGVRAGYGVVSGFHTSLGGRPDYDGPEATVGASWVIGSGAR
jgi:hypothetical protein